MGKNDYIELRDKNESLSEDIQNEDKKSSCCGCFCKCCCISVLVLIIVAIIVIIVLGLMFGEEAYAAYSGYEEA